MSVGPITRHDIRQWEADEGVSLELWERRAILALDAAWRASIGADEAEENQDEAPNG